MIKMGNEWNTEYDLSIKVYILNKNNVINKGKKEK